LTKRQVLRARSASSGTRRKNRRDLTATVFDPDSIMEYPVAAKLTTDHAVIGGNLDLSPTDKELIAKFYPEPTPAANAQQSHASAARQTAGGC
jgi:hypothetical protein